METIYPSTNEIDPQEVFKTMRSDFFKLSNSFQILSINKEYLNKRKDLINFNHKIAKKIGFKSQTFFLSIYYLDIIFISNKNIQITNYFLLSLSCLIIAAKYCEIDPNVPPLQNFINIYNRYKLHQIGMRDILKMEVNILKFLNYNIHYVTIYDFNLFFFNHGIIKKQQIKDIINNNSYFNKNTNCNNNKSDISSKEELDFLFDDSFYIKKILEKVYKKSRYYLDLIISNENICFKYDALLISICIMKKSIEEIILKEYKLKYKDYFLYKNQIIKKNNNYFKEIMKNFYKIDFESIDKYHLFMRDKEVINLFSNREKEKKILDIKNTKNIINNNMDYFIKVSKYKNKKFKENNNNYNTINTAETKNNNKSFNLINLNNSLEPSKEKHEAKPKLTLFKNYIHKINTGKNENGNNEINSNSFRENVRNKYTFTQLKDNLNRDLSIRKKRCNDRYRHINNLKSLCKMTSCAAVIQNIKESSLSKSKITNENTNLYKNSNISTNIKKEKNNSNSNIANKEYRKNDNSKEKMICQSNNIVNMYKIHNNKLLKLENLENNNNKIRYNKVLITDNFQSKEKKKLSDRKTITETKFLENIQKPYNKKVIQNYDPMNKKIINKNNIKINIYNILNTPDNIKDIYDKKIHFDTLTNNMNYSQHKKNGIESKKNRMNDIDKLKKLKNIYNYKKLPNSLKYNNITENKIGNILPKSSSRSKEINYINIINNTNDDDNNLLNNKVSNFEHKYSYLKKQVINFMTQDDLKKNKYILKPDNINSERKFGKLNKYKLLTNKKIRDITENNNNINNSEINEYFIRKNNSQFHSKLFSTLSNNIK